MDGFEFVAAMVDHLVWPAVALTALLVLRKPISARIGQLKSLSAGSFGAEFGEAERQVEQAVEAEANRVEDVDHLAIAEAPVVAEIDRLEHGFQEIARSAGNNPTYAVVASWGLLEDILASAAADVSPLNVRSRLGAGRSVSGRTATSILLEQGAISDDTYRALASLRSLRNDVAHGKAAPEPGAALAYVQSANELADVVREGTYAAWQRRRSEQSPGATPAP
ncbi:hypothetical protein [Krasilnikovia cinnamomea]|uniref:hypothetical protein n=1 Tax=Krasilnikovia cinnamomea TaxID=349313 RepID=UPI00102B3654|nr:hypothetical protein [Krasilnikovia cinnamomea]